MTLYKKEGLKNRAVTLIELLTAVIIIGILVTLALPMFTKTLETTRAKQAVAALQQIRTGERIYRTTENYYYPHHTGHPGAQDDEAEINRVLRTFLDTREEIWRYKVDTSTTDTFTGTAERTSGKNVGETITIDRDGDLGGTWSP